MVWHNEITLKTFRA